MYTEYQTKIIELLKNLPFTAKDRAKEAEMILKVLEERIKKPQDNIDFKEELQQIIAEGKEV